MAIDLTNTPVAEEPVENVAYIWRISGAACKKSKDNDNLRLDLRATIVEGDCTGYEASLPTLMLFDSSGKNRTAQWIGRAKTTLGKILGDPALVTDLPSHEGEVTETMKRLINAYFEAPAKFVPEQEDKVTGRIYDAKWEVGRIIGPADPSHVVEVDWSEFFKD